MKFSNLWIVVGASIFYFVVIIFFRGNDACELLKTGNLNELGDFLAGLFTPLAFLWLVYGYLLQSEELRLQHKELSLTRDQLGKQTELLQEQVEADLRDTRPHLIFRIALYGSFSRRLIIENKGGNAKNIELRDPDKNQTLEKINSLARNESFQFTDARVSPSHLY